MSGGRVGCRLPPRTWRESEGVEGSGGRRVSKRGRKTVEMKGIPLKKKKFIRHPTKYSAKHRETMTEPQQRRLGNWRKTEEEGDGEKEPEEREKKQFEARIQG